MMISVSFDVIKQISTQKKDYLVDTIALHDSMGILRPVFANPSICKVCKLLESCFLAVSYDLETYWGRGDDVYISISFSF